ADSEQSGRPARARRCLTSARAVGRGTSVCGGVVCGPRSRRYLIRHPRAAQTHRLRRLGRGVARSLAFHLGIQLRSYDHDRARDPDPGHEADDRAEGAVGLVVRAEIRHVPGEEHRYEERDDEGENGSRRGPHRYSAANPSSAITARRAKLPILISHSVPWPSPTNCNTVGSSTITPSPTTPATMVARVNASEMAVSLMKLLRSRSP